MEKELILKIRCFNCDSQIEVRLNYCPNCGQKVDSNDLKLRSVFGDFVENYISLDSRLGRSIFPFLFKPGMLTNKFIQGKRKDYANPFRLYLFISIFFFFSLNLLYQSKNDKKRGIAVKLEKRVENPIVNFSELPDSANYKLNKGLSRVILNELIEQQDSGFQFAFDQLTNYRKKKVTQLLDDSLQESINLPNDETFLASKAEIGFLNDTSGFTFSFNEMDYGILEENRYKYEVSDEQLLDLMNLGDLTKLNRLLSIQFIKVYRTDSRTFTKFLIGNGSIAMLVMIPVFALILSLFYLRIRRFYVEHLIHALHLHSFSFFVYSLAILLIILFQKYELGNWFLSVAFILSSIYLYKSLKRVYGQSGRKTIFKFILLGSTYFIFLTVGFILELLVSFAIF